MGQILVIKDHSKYDNSLICFNKIKYAIRFIEDYHISDFELYSFINEEDYCDFYNFLIEKHFYKRLYQNCSCCNKDKPFYR